MTTQTTTPKDSPMIHISLSQCLPATMTLANALPTTVPTIEPTIGAHAALQSIEDVRAENAALQKANQGIHVPLIGQRHFPEAAANIDMAESAWTYAEALS